MSVPAPRELPQLGRAAWRTWGAKGLARRGAYEGRRRTGRLTGAEVRWLEQPRTVRPLLAAGVRAPSRIDVDGGDDDGVLLYGGLRVEPGSPPAWHRHPVTGHGYAPDVHWSALSDADPAAGDVKDVWELGRLGWLLPRLRRWAATGDEAIAEELWRIVEDWHRANPPYRGVHWMCGQETSLRTITTMVLADALRASGTTTDVRRELVATMVFDAVGRVAPTLGYALSQRNNHAISEAGFLWSAAVLAPWLPGADRLRRRAAAALSEAVADQFAADGSYSQHAPTYERLALQVLLWCLGVARSTGATVPDGVSEAVARGAGHLRSLVVPGGDGAIPNLGGNDGALLLPLTSRPIGDFRPVLVHARAATGGSTDLDSGPWDEEAAWFGVEARRTDVPSIVPGAVTRALTVGGTHVVFRAGALDHRPAHADQLHVDVWFDGVPVVIDPGTFRYTAPAPWGNALSGDDVHNVPRVDGEPQAERAGRFFWKRWSEAETIVVDGAPRWAVRGARLPLPSGATIERDVHVRAGLVVVRDRVVGAAGAIVRWNLSGPAEATSDRHGTRFAGSAWSIRIGHPGSSLVRTGVDDDPTSGWASPTYAVRTPITAVEVPLLDHRPTVTVFFARGEGAVDDAALEALVAGSSPARAGLSPTATS